MRRLKILLLILISISFLPTNALALSYEQIDDASTEGETDLITEEEYVHRSSSVYYTDFTAEYYLIKDENNVGRLHVREEIAGIFPQANINHGLTRTIPRYNLDGKNVIADTVEDLNLSVTRNGAREFIAKTSIYKDEIEFYFGDADEYVHGKQVYNLEYDYTNVVSSFDKSKNLTKENPYIQELYWDTNGTGWDYSFDRLSVFVYIPGEFANKIEPNSISCYVGSFNEGNPGGKNIHDDCIFEKQIIGSIEDAPDGFDNRNVTVLSFKTNNLPARNNLSFAVDFSGDAGFITVDPPKDYTTVILLVIHLSIILILAIFAVYKYIRYFGAKNRYRKSLFVKPEYQVPKNCLVAEAGTLYTKYIRSPKVATMLEMAVNHKIEIKTETVEAGFIVKRQETVWGIKVISDNLTEQESIVLRILKGAPYAKFEVGDEFSIEEHAATRSLFDLSNKYDSIAEKNLEDLGLFEKNPKKASYALTVYAWIHLIFIQFFILAIFSENPTILERSAYDLFTMTLHTSLIDILVIIVSSIIAKKSNKWAKHTNAGIDMHCYLEGLYLYISMAEAERIKFLQSTDGADTSPKGIVKLYEKLLPYAALFGLEKSWMAEFSRYCQNIDYTPEWYPSSTVLEVAAFNSIISSTSSTISSSTAYYSSSGGSGGSGSSSSSGGGGGGSSGGGGGGGGGGAW